ncbi:hypothetical protein ACG2LH_17980 [Zhouia sp. PK063]|uniref:hypothetical protein n=1 Tax=Zhouia sp. PK063 TaxID=3373602 RepID=UPI0037BAC455
MYTSSKLITVDQAKEMSETFVADLETANTTIQGCDENGKKFKVSASSYYTLEELEAYIEYLKTEAQDKDYVVEGIRIYFGVYPEVAEKGGYNTCFLSPAGRKKGGVGGSETPGDITDLDPLNHGTEGQPPEATYPQ